MCADRRLAQPRGLSDLAAPEAGRWYVGAMTPPHRSPSPRADHRTLVVLQPGYVLHDRLLRPALVGVAKGEAAPSEIPGELSGKLIPVAEQGNEKAHNHTQLAADKVNYEKLTQPKFWEWTKPATMVRAANK